MRQINRQGGHRGARKLGNRGVKTHPTTDTRRHRRLEGATGPEREVDRRRMDRVCGEDGSGDGHAS